MRLDLFDDEIESIKTFEPDSQRTLYPVNELSLLPAREFPTDEAGRTLFRQRFREVFEGDPSRAVAYKDVSTASSRAASSSTCRCFRRAETLFDHAPADAVFVLLGDVHATLTDSGKETRERWGCYAATAHVRYWSPASCTWPRRLPASASSAFGATS